MIRKLNHWLIRFDQALRRNDNNTTSDDSQTVDHGNHDEHATILEDNIGPRKYSNDNNSCNFYHYDQLTYSKTCSNAQICNNMSLKELSSELKKHRLLRQGKDKEDKTLFCGND